MRLFFLQNFVKDGFLSGSNLRIVRYRCGLTSLLFSLCRFHEIIRLYCSLDSALSNLNKFLSTLNHFLLLDINVNEADFLANRVDREHALALSACGLVHYTKRLLPPPDNFSKAL